MVDAVGACTWLMEPMLGKPLCCMHVMTFPFLSVSTLCLQNGRQTGGERFQRDNSHVPKKKGLHVLRKCSVRGPLDAVTSPLVQ